MENQRVYNDVQEHYGLAARTSDDNAYGRKVAEAFGYSEAELANTPANANLGLSCGNPLALANLKEVRVAFP